MFSIDCPVHRRQVLVPPSRIRSVHNTDQGILLLIECWCGTYLATRTGRRHVTASSVTPLMT